MDWKKYWNDVSQNNENLNKQVQRNSNVSTSKTSAYIVNILDLKKKDSVLDLCCGNGLITNEIHARCNSIVGVDQSENLIKIAKEKFQHSNTKFYCLSALEFSDKIDEKFDKIYLEFSFQYFDKKNEAELVITEMLKVLKPNGKIFIGDIPEKGKEATLYNSLKKKMYRLSSKIKGTDTMGKFWDVKEIDAICEKLHIKGLKIEQPPHLPYAHYRFDYLIEKE